MKLQLSVAIILTLKFPWYVTVLNVETYLLVIPTTNILIPASFTCLAARYTEKPLFDLPSVSKIPI